MDWNQVADGFREPRATRGWYLHHARVHAGWIRRTRPGRPALKTDLFEEATGTHSLLGEMPDGGLGAVCLDVSPGVVRRARPRVEPSVRLLAADARALPFRRGSLGGIVSLSTLDHLDGPAEIVRALAEIRRALRPGGSVLVTLDNPQNPVLRLRAALPARWLRRTGAVSFAPGATLGLEDALRAVRSVGLRVEHAGPLLFAPRLPILAGLRLAARVGIAPRPARVLRWLDAMERLGRTLAPRLAAQYVGVVARAPG